MKARVTDPGSPNTFFRGPRVAPTLESVSISDGEFAVRTADAMNLEAEVIRDRRAYEARVAEAAYFLAQRRGFEPGRELDDWVAAEAQMAHARVDSSSKAKEI